MDTNPLALGSVLADPYAFAYSTAAYFYGLTTYAHQRWIPANRHRKTSYLPATSHTGLLLFLMICSLELKLSMHMEALVVFVGIGTGQQIPFWLQ